MSDFNDLLFEAEKLSNAIENTTDLPKVERSLRQVLEASNELYTRVSQTGGHDIQANLLLGSKGIDLPQISQKLESISSKRTFEPLDPIADNDVQSFLKNEMENCILNCIDDVHKRTFSGIEEQMWEHINAEWKQEKRKILNAMIGPSQNFLDIRKQEVFTYMQQRPVSGALTYTEQIYARQIMDYNQMLVQTGTRPVLVDLLAKAAEQFKDSKVNDMWDMMKHMLELPPFPKSEDIIQSRNSPKIIKALVNQAKKYLEGRYQLYMGTVTNENLQQARRGGIPGVYHLVRSFVGIRLQGGYLGLQDGTIEDRPLWPMVYYCLRSGDLSATLHCLSKAGSPFEDLVSILQEKLHRSETLIPKLQSSIRFQYRRQVRNSTDPFKRAVYCILACCDVGDEHSEVAKTADDYLWLKLNMVRCNGESEEFISYSTLQSTILEEYGESHYEAHIQPHLYFQMLLLTGQFEAAIEFLARTERYRQHAVHFAITINELFMLAGPRCVDAPLISVDTEDPPPARRLNLARLIMLYVKKFETNSPVEAMHYYYMLRHMQTLDKQNLFMVCVSDLAQETRDYDLIFGKVLQNYKRVGGIINQFTDANLNMENLAEMVAAELKKKGLYEDAIKLYDLADNQEDALSLLSLLLSQVVHLQSQPGDMRDRLSGLCQMLDERYARTGIKCCVEITSTFSILRDFLIFFDQYHSKQYNLAIETLNNINIIPLQLSQVDEKAMNFKHLSGEVCKVIPDVVLATMNILYDQYKVTKKSSTMLTKLEGNSHVDQLQFIRDQAKAITNFAGAIPYRMPGDTNTKLVQIEIMMH